jgi:hypothetical protein
MKDGLTYLRILLWLEYMPSSPQARYCISSAGPEDRDTARGRSRCILPIPWTRRKLSGDDLDLLLVAYFAMDEPVGVIQFELPVLIAQHG